MTINKTAFIGELLISSGVLNEEERKLGVQRERENVSKHFRSEPVLKNFPDPAEKAAFEAKCDAFTKACESDPDCKLTISELARSVKIEEKYLLEGPRFTNALKELIGESKITSMTLDEFKTVCELLNAMQAIGRAEGIIGTFTTKDKLHDSIPKDKLEAIQATYSSSPEVKLDALPNNEPWIKSPIQVTRESQAVTSILKCFVTASAQAMDMDKNLYRVPAMEKAVKAAAALQHLLKKELLEELKKTGKGGAAIDLLTE